MSFFFIQKNFLRVYNEIDHIHPKFPLQLSSNLPQHVQLPTSCLLFYNRLDAVSAVCMCISVGSSTRAWMPPVTTPSAADGSSVRSCGELESSSPFCMLRFGLLILCSCCEHISATTPSWSEDNTVQHPHTSVTFSKNSNIAII